jgi:hypothetical protein
VHFAVDPEEVHMTTCLHGEKTFFLPFNRGSDPGSVKCGAGNPQHPFGYYTGYFWKEILSKDYFIEIFGNLMGASYRVMTFSFISLWGIAQGIQPIIGANYVAKKYDRVKIISLE